MKERNIHKERALGYLLMLLILTSVVFSLSNQFGEGDVVSYLADNLHFVFLMLITIFFWAFFLIKGSTREELKVFIKKHLLRYVSKFISVIIAGFLVYFVLIPNKLEGWTENLISLFLIIVAFVLFLFSEWFSEIELPEVSKKGVINGFLYLFKSSIVLLIPLSIFFFLNYFAVRISLIPSLVFSISLFVGMVASMSPVVVRKWTGYLILLFMNSLLIFFIFWAHKIPEFELSLEFVTIYSVVYLIFSVVCLLISIFFRETTWFKLFSKYAYEGMS